MFLCVDFKNTLKISKILKHQGKQQVLLIQIRKKKCDRKNIKHGWEGKNRVLLECIQT